MAICSSHARKLLHRPGWVKPPRAPHTPDPRLASEVAPKLLPSTSGPSSLDCQLPGQVSPSSLCVLPSSGPGTCWGHNAHLLCDKQNATGCTHHVCSRHLPVPGAAGPLPPRAPAMGQEPQPSKASPLTNPQRVAPSPRLWEQPHTPLFLNNKPDQSVSPAGSLLHMTFSGAVFPLPRPLGTIQAQSRKQTDSLAAATGGKTKQKW